MECSVRAGAETADLRWRILIGSMTSAVLDTERTFREGDNLGVATHLPCGLQHAAQNLTERKRAASTVSLETRSHSKALLKTDETGVFKLTACLHMFQWGMQSSKPMHMAGNQLSQAPQGLNVGVWPQGIHSRNFGARNSYTTKVL